MVSVFYCFMFCNDVIFCFFFFFQAEDGIRDYKVTGVQTCALPIWAHGSTRCATRWRNSWRLMGRGSALPVCLARSEERRVRKECRSRRATKIEIKKKEK